MPHQNKSTLSCCLTVLLLLVPVTSLKGSDKDIIDRLKNDIEYLCSPELAGRDIPGETGDKAALWIEKRFSELKLGYGVEDSSYLQEVPLVIAQLDTEITSLTIFCDDWFKEFLWGEDFYIFPKGVAPIDTILNASFCGYGIVSEDLGRDDFGKNALNTAAIVLPYGPEKVGRLRSAPFKAAAAQRAGAEMLLIAYPIWNGSSWPPNDLDDKIKSARCYRSDLPGAVPSFPLIYLNGYFMSKHIAGGDPQQEWEDDPEFARAVSGLDVALKVDYCDRKDEKGYNVIARLEGKIPEYIIVGAHYDHLGIVTNTEKMEYHPGADDNASGVAGLIEIYRRWADRERPGRGLIAVAFTAEEDGMLGSKWFVDHLPVKQESIVAMVNLDEIGRRGFASMRDVHRPDTEPEKEYAAAYYSGASPQLEKVIESASRSIDLKLSAHPVNSFSHFGDAGPFHEAQIPTVHLFSGFHADYHSPSDTPDKLDYEKMAKMIDLTDSLLVKLSVTEKIGFDPSIRVEKPRIPH